MLQTLEVLYFALFVGGACFAAVGWLVSLGHGHGHVANARLPAHPYALAHAHGVAAVLNAGVLSGAACAGGAAGLIALSLGAGAAASVVAAVAVATIGGASVAKVFAWLAGASTFQEAAHPRLATSLTDFSGDRVGEVVWLHNDSRRPLPARSDDGSKITRGTEVVVLAVDHGIARVVPSDRVFHVGEEHRHGS